MSWDGIPEHRNPGGDNGEPKAPFGRWRDFFGATPQPPPLPVAPDDPFNGMAAPAVATTEMFRAYRDAGMTEQQALFFCACLVQVGLAIQQGGLVAQPPDDPPDPGGVMAGEVTFKPIDPAWPEARKAAGIDLALRSGSTWGQVAAALGLPGKREAKRYRRELEHRVRLRQLSA